MGEKGGQGTVVVVVVAGCVCVCGGGGGCGGGGVCLCESDLVLHDCSHEKRAARRYEEYPHYHGCLPQLQPSFIRRSILHRSMFHPDWRCDKRRRCATKIVEVADLEASHASAAVGPFILSQSAPRAPKKVERQEPGRRRAMLRWTAGPAFAREALAARQLRVKTEKRD